MKSNRSGIFFKLEKTSKSIEMYKNLPLVLLMKDKHSDEFTYSEMYIGTLDCIVDNQIYLADAYAVEGDVEEYLQDEFKKWDLSREDPGIKEFPHIRLDFVESVYASKLNLTLEQVWNAWSDPRDLLATENPLYQKIQLGFSENEKGFDENSPPVYFDERGDKISLAKIHEMESVNGSPVSLIAVTRQQFGVMNFSKYEKYIRNEFPENRVYYGLWSDSETQHVEYDVLYAIPTDNFEQVQEHLNLHDGMNKGVTQKMALVIFSGGAFEIIENRL